jgi:hypothetical protein
LNSRQQFYTPEAYRDFLRVCWQFDVILSRCSKEFTLEHYHTPGVYGSKSMTAEINTLKIFRSTALWETGGQERSKDIFALKVPLKQ